ncbi:pirin family protein [Paenibacillus radicis (ex Gao et al. 2016)]|uniref:Quercetin 2,3-dioxygenase n=1 Tax=Paenibacillus radicis (ex Gao et al. 2016) TaxID=1737354 RepID=A0A917M503_9BACL|nr:pirin family protein [Paenibacillus radicis (ex Gao et al. 2016)]GGG75797.1 quercetin 2,3-dioxygenase [Paenibacillus radicis (ex Gao et al. 2016)]
MTNTATYREIEGTFQGSPFHMVGDGFRVSNYFPGGNSFEQRISPFVLMDYGAPVEFPPGAEVKGIGAHPHRGFETVTIAYQGRIEHHDSAGNHGIIGPGDVQWMTAGSGVLHKEYQEKSFSEQGGVMQMIQLWVNLPQANKMTTPGYQELLSSAMGRVELPNEGGSVRIIAGEYNGVRGPASTYTPLNLFDIDFNQGGQASFTLPVSYNAGLLVLRGEVMINEHKQAAENDFVLFRNEPGGIRIEALTEDALVLVLSGEPINEPMVQRGPFVMNTDREITQAFHDFRTGAFGNPNF